MTARRSVPCWPADCGPGCVVYRRWGVRSGRCLQCGLPASSGCGGHCAAAFERGAKRNGRDRADQARPASAADRRARSDGLAAGIWLQLACPGGGRYRPLQERDRGRAALTDQRAAVDRGGHCCRLAKSHARARAARVPSSLINANAGRRLRPATDPCNKVTADVTVAERRVSHGPVRNLSTRNKPGRGGRNRTRATALISRRRFRSPSAPKAHARGSGGSTCCGEWAPALLSGLADQHVVGNRSGAGADAEESIERRMPCAAPVEAEYELVQVVLKICPSQAVVNTQAPALEI